MKLRKIAACIDYHQRAAEAAEAADEPVLAGTHDEVVDLLRGIHEPAALAHARRQQFTTEKVNAVSRTSRRG